MMSKSRRVITREPSAELGPNQRDQDTLPPYEVLDSIIESFVENDRVLKLSLQNMIMTNYGT